VLRAASALAQRGMGRDPATPPPPPPRAVVANQVALNLNLLVRAGVGAIVTVTLMIALSPRLATAVCLLVPVTGALSTTYGRITSRLSDQTQRALARAGSVAEEAVSGLGTVRAHAAESDLARRYKRALDGYARVAICEAKVYAAYAGGQALIPTLLAALTASLGGFLALRVPPILGAGELVSFLLYTQALSNQTGLIGDVVGGLSRALGTARGVLSLLRRLPKDGTGGSEIQPTHGAAISSPLELGLRPEAGLAGAVALEKVTFRYPTRGPLSPPALQEMTLALAPGSRTALVGPSGGGKSSVVRLLLRLYDPDAGKVTYDGIDLRSLDAAWLRRRVGVVPQEPALFSLTVAENVALGLSSAADAASPPPTRADVEAACRLAGAHDFVSALPRGYDTPCGERGGALSGGQRQRLALARALVRRPAVLLLDEATSALDAESEDTVREALDRLGGDGALHRPTLLVVAHRLATVRRVGRVVVIVAGRVVEEGPPRELASRTGGAFSALVRRQGLADPGAWGDNVDDDRGDVLSRRSSLDVGAGAVVAVDVGCSPLGAGAPDKVGDDGDGEGQ